MSSTHFPHKAPSPTFVLPTLTPFLMAAVGATLEAVARKRERKRQPAGTLIALREDGRRMHVVYHAPPSLRRAPCVVLEAGANSWSPMWKDVALQLGQFARVLRYDRAGFGFSDGCEPGRMRGVAEVATELAQMISAVGAAPPYVLVAHSLGALYINRLMQLLAPGDVCGIVYVDAASPDTVRMLEKVVPKGSPPVWLARCLGRLGFLRLLVPVILRQYALAFGRELKDEAIATWATADWLLAYTGEWAAVMSNVRADDTLTFPPGWLGSLPIAVLVPDVYERTARKAYISVLQSRLTAYSSNALLIPVLNCGHFVQLEKPDVVTSAVQAVIHRAQHGARLLPAAHDEEIRK